MSGFSRRGFLTGAAVSTSAFALAGCNNQGSSPDAGAQEQPALADALVAFDGKHQAGIATAAQAHLNLVGFDLKRGVDKRGFASLMKLWTEDARALCTGEAPLGTLEPEMVQQPANLTITCGLGQKVFSLLGVEKPRWLGDVRSFKRDALEPKWGQSDIVLQICCDDPLMNTYALRHMVRAGEHYAGVKWLQQGFINAYGSHEKGATARNMFGQKDGTVNPRSEEDFAAQVWIDKGPKWAQGGTAMVMRRIRMNVDTWEKLDRASRENAVGRKLDTGAPLTGEKEFDAADFDAVDDYGLPVIDKNSHMAVAAPPADHPEQRILRRPYNYELAPDGKDGQLSNIGQVFICYQQDPTKQFEPIQARLDKSDLLNEWLTHIGSAMYFCPPGTRDADGRESWWAKSLCEHAGL
ncbi:Dyp-type peroxidase [Corynebacterium marquesiae]|uniref:Dyp-type peroxidase n=1 Tax=Corynebacterium marquesiae TaxID=2913503 RepID=UPI0038D1DCC6